MRVNVSQINTPEFHRGGASSTRVKLRYCNGAEYTTHVTKQKHTHTHICRRDRSATFFLTEISLFEGNLPLHFCHLLCMMLLFSITLL